MRKALHYTIILIFSGLFNLNAQVNVDHPIVLTGSGANAKVTGIQSVTNTQDATNAGTIQNGGIIYATDLGSPNAYVVNLSPAVSAYTAGMIVNFKSRYANTGASTININGIGADTIKKQVTTNLAANDILANQDVSVIYDGANFQMLSQSGNVPAPHGKQIFWNNGTFNVPAGVSTVWVSMSGGGGGGCYATSSRSGGGGADAVKDSLLTLAQSSYAITVGSGGAGGTSANGSDGGNSLFGTLVTTNGGSGGTTGSGGNAGGPGGQNGLAGAPGTGIGGAGGGSIFGGGGGGAVNSPGGNGSGYGAGGGGGAEFNNGGNGSQGFVLVEW